MNSLTEVSDWLIADGWHECRKSALDRCDRSWWKRFAEVEPRCQTNSSKPGIMIVIECFDHTQRGGYVGFQIELRAEPRDGVWVELVAYSLSLETIIDELPRQVDKLVRAWKAVQ